MHKISQKVIASGMSLVLAVGLTPVPAFAATSDLAAGSSQLTTQASNKISMSDCSASWDVTSTHVYNGAAFTPEPTVTYYGIQLVKNRDYTVKYQQVQESSWEEILSAFGDDYFKYVEYYDEDGNPVYGYDYDFYGEHTAPNGVVYGYGSYGYSYDDEWDYGSGYGYYKITDVTPKAVGTYQATITGAGAYEGTKKLSFSIVEDLTWDDVTTSFLGVKSEFAYTGGVIRPTAVVKLGESILTPNVDYTVKYQQYQRVTHTETVDGYTYTYTDWEWVDANPVNVDDQYRVAVIPAGKFAVSDPEELAYATHHLYFSIVNSKNLASANVVWQNNGLELYTGANLAPRPIVVADGTELTFGVDYRVTYQQRVKATRAQVVAALGEDFEYNYERDDNGDYIGTDFGRSYEFESYDEVNGYDPGYYTYQNVTPNAVGDYYAYILGIGSYQSTTNTPNFIRSTFSVYAGKSLGDSLYTDVTFTQGNRFAFTGGVIAPKPVVTYRGETLVEGKDYTLSYENDKTYLPGHYEVYVNGIGAYGGTAYAGYTIYSKTDLDAADITMPNGGNTNFAYTGDAIDVKPSKVELYGKTLKEGRDYTVAYMLEGAVWVNEPIEVGDYTMYIIGKGIYSADYTTASFRIVEKNSLLAATIVMKNTFDYTSKTIKPKPVVTLNGKLLKNKKDYKLAYFGDEFISYDGYKQIKKPVNAGSYDVQITPKSSKYIDVVYTSFNIKPINLNDESVEVSLKKETVAYAGKGKAAKNPKVVVKLDGKKVKAKKNFDVSYAQGAIELGTYAVTVNGKNNYTGSVDLSYQVGPADTKIKKVTGKNKAFTVKWKKVSKKKKNKGYEVRYSVNKDMSGAKTKTVKKASKTKLTVKKLQAGTKYYVQVRTWTKANGEKIYGNWSKAKKVTTK